MAAHVPVVKMFRLIDNITLDQFMRLIGEGTGSSAVDPRPTRAIIFDDVEQSKGSGVWRVVMELATRLAHHLSAYFFFTSHMLFVEKEQFRVLQRNASYLVLFPSIRDRGSVGILARRCFGDKPEILTRAYEDLLRKADKQSFLVLDLRPRLAQELLRVRRSFRLDAPLVGYLQETDANELLGESRRPSSTRKRRTKPEGS